MAPVVSRLRAEATRGTLPRRALAQYLLLLRLYPVLTKAASSGALLALGNVLAQMIEKKRKKEGSQNLDVGGPLRYAVYGFFFTGPLSHYFYLLMDHWIPPGAPWASVRRLLLDRLVFAPAFLLLFFFIMNLLEEQAECHPLLLVPRGAHRQPAGADTSGSCANCCVDLWSGLLDVPSRTHMLCCVFMHFKTRS